MSQAKVRSTAHRRDDDEAALIGGYAHDGQRGAQDRVGPVEQAAGERAVGEHEPHPGAQVGLQQGGLGAVAVLHRGGDDHDGEQQAEGVGDDEPLGRPYQRELAARDTSVSTGARGVAAAFGGAQPEGLGAGLDDGGVEGEPVYDGRAEPGVGEGTGPFAERGVARDGDAGAFFAFGEHLEQQFRAAAIEFEISEFVEAENSISAATGRERPTSRA